MLIRSAYNGIYIGTSTTAIENGAAVRDGRSVEHRLRILHALWILDCNTVGRRAQGAGSSCPHY